MARICTFLAVAAVTAIAGCGTPVTPQSTAPSAAAAPPAIRPQTVNTGWLYLAEDQYGVGIVYIFGYPDENRVHTKAIANLGFVYGPCVDGAGKVWIPAAKNGNFHVYQFATDKTKVLARLEVPYSFGIGGCAVDPLTGNLGVLGNASASIFSNAQGKPANYTIGNVTVQGCAYDDKGNLFVDAMKFAGSSLAVFALYELPKGSTAFHSIKLDKRTGFAGGIAWDGQYLALVTGGNGIKPTLYRFTVSGTKGTVVQSVHLNGLSYDAWFAIGDGRIAGTSGLYGARIRYWPYPGGGAWTSEVRTADVQGMAIAPL